MARLQPMGIRAVAANVRPFVRQVDKMNKSIEKNTKATTDAKKASDKLNKTYRKLVGGAVAVTAGFLAVQKALAFGREGALLTQTSESFDFLLEKIGAAPDLLDQLKVASKGTITEMSLMTSTATLLAGAGDDLALALANATPQLLNIAKAANKLNPALGDTSFLYQSIATGVKRAQPLILDNLGITIKVGEANEKFAASIGKTVEQLTSEEKAMAILQGTLIAGDNLIAQVGGSTDSLTDSFDRLTVALTETSDAVKKRAAPTIARYVEFLPLWLNWNEQLTDSLVDHEASVRKTATTYEDYLAEIERANSLTAGYGIQVQALDNSTFEYLRSVKEINPELRLHASIIGGVAEASLGAAVANQTIVASLTELTEAKLASEALGALNTAFKEGTIDADTYRSEFVNVAAKLGNMDSEAIKAQLSLFDLKQELAAGTTSAIEFADELVRTGDEFKEIDFGEGITTQFLENTRTDFLEAQVQAAAIAVEAGDTTAWGAATELADGFANGVFGARDAIKDAREELALLDGTTVDVVIEITTTGGLPEFQHGGQFTVGGKPGVDQNLVAFRASRGEVVTVTPTSNVDNRSVNMGDINMGQGGLSPTQFDRMIRDWMG